MVRWLAVILLLLLIGLQWKLWVGDHGVQQMHTLEASVKAQKQQNEKLKQRNDALEADVQDLKKGGQAVESRARSELGLIKPGETFYQVVPASAASSSGAGKGD
jgi:cell division protein FtsB